MENVAEILAVVLVFAPMTLSFALLLFNESDRVREQRVRRDREKRELIRALGRAAYLEGVLSNYPDILPAQDDIQISEERNDVNGCTDS